MLYLSSEQIASAPVHVQCWLVECIGLDLVAVWEALENPPNVTTSKASTATDNSADAGTDTPPSLKDVQDRAAALIKSKGTNAMKAILTEMGIGRVKECPEERLAELLGKIAVAA